MKHSRFTQDEDAPLLLAWHRGDLSAFGTLVWKYQNRVFNLAILLTGNHDSAAKAVENTFITAFQNIRSHKSTCRFSSWLITILIKECREIEDLAIVESGHGDEVTPVPDQNYTNTDIDRLVSRIRELPRELGEVIILRYVREYSLSRVEEILQIPNPLLLDRLFEAQETLASLLKDSTVQHAGHSDRRPGDTVLHPEILRSFAAYLDDSAEGDEKESTKSHLRSCGSCREALAELEWMIQDIRRIPDTDPPAWIVPAIMEKLKNSPEPPVKHLVPVRLKQTGISAGLLLAAAAAVTVYMYGKPKSPPEFSPAAVTSVTPQPDSSANNDFTEKTKGVLKGSVNVNQPANQGISVSTPRVQPQQAPHQSPQAAVPVKASQPVKIEPVSKRDKTETASPLLQEWGDTPPPVRTAPKKKSTIGIRGGELEVVLNVAGPLAAANDIDSAVISAGGKINGRAYSNGTDILYTSVEKDRLFDLLSRLGKVGRIQQLPQIPEGEQDPVDLIIKW